MFLDSKVQIIDFGCATTEEYVEEDGRVGTEGFMAPEVSEGLSYYPKKADLYSAGKVVAEFAGEADRYALSPLNLRNLSAMLAKEKDSERLSLSSFFNFFDQYHLEREIDEWKIDQMIGSFVRQRSRPTPLMRTDG